MAKATEPACRTSAPAQLPAKPQQSGLLRLLPSRKALTSCLAPNLKGGRAAKLAAAALEESLEGLSSLDVSYVSYNAGVATTGLAVSIGSAGPSLRHLDLSHLGATQGHEAFAKAIVGSLSRCPSLRTLNLSNNSLCDAGLELLLPALAPGSRATAPALEELDLSWNRLSDGNILARLLAGGGRCLRVLSLEANTLSDVAIVALCAGLSLNPQVRSLNLARNCFGDDGVVALANAMRCTAEASRGNAAEPDAQAAPLSVPALARWMLGMQCALEQGGPPPALDSELGLRQLELSHNRISDTGAAALAAALRPSDAAGSGLALLGLAGSSVGSRGRAALEQAVCERRDSVEEFAAAAGLALRGEGPPPESRPPRPLAVRGLGLEALTAELAGRAASWLEGFDAALLALSPCAGTAGRGGSPAPELHDRAKERADEKEPREQKEEAAEPGKTVASPQLAPLEPNRFGMTDADSDLALDEPESEASMASRAADTPQEAPMVEVAEEEEEEATSPLMLRSMTEVTEEVAVLRARRIVQQQRGRLEEGSFFQSSASSPEPEQEAEVDCSTSSSASCAGSEAGWAPGVARRSPLVACCRPREPLHGGCGRIEFGDLEELCPLARCASEPCSSQLQRALRQEASAALAPARAAAGTAAAVVTFAEEEAEAAGPASNSRSGPCAGRPPAPPQPLAAVAAAELGEPGGLPRPPLAVGAPAEPAAAPAPEGEGERRAAETAEAAAVGQAELPPPPPPAPRPGKGGGKARPPAPPPPPKAKGGAAGAPLPPPPVAEAPAAKACGGKAKGKGKGPPPPPGKPRQQPQGEGGAEEEAASPAGDAVTPAAPAGPPAPKGKGKGKGGKGGPPAPAAKAGGGGGADAPAGPPLPAKGKGKGKGGAPPPKSGAAPPSAKAGIRRSQTTALDHGCPPFHRKLHWKPLDLTNAEGTIFNDRPASSDVSPHIDVGALQRMFEGESEKLAAAAARSSSLLKSVQGRAEGTKILSDNRARNVAIILKRLPASTMVLSRILRQLEWESEVFRTDQLEQITDAIPTKEEVDQLLPHASPEASAKLRDVEQLVLPLAHLRRGTARVRLICCARNAAVQVEAASEPMVTLRAACDAIHGSETLRVVMLSALEIGNYINHGDSNKGAKAITIGSLLQLRDFKMGRMSSLHFLCAQLRLAGARADASAALQRELRPVVEASKFQIQGISQAVRAFDAELNMIRTECKNFAREYDDTGGEGAGDGDEETQESLDNAMHIRGSARQRLTLLASVVERHSERLHADMERTAAQVQATLRFCGVKASDSREVPADIEPVLGQLAEFVRVFAQHWGEVNNDLARYSAFFTGAGLQE